MDSQLLNYGSIILQTIRKACGSFLAFKNLLINWYYLRMMTLILNKNGLSSWLGALEGFAA